MQDFVVPASADAMTYHTVVLWDTEMTHPIAAAPLQQSCAAALVSVRQADR